MTTTATKPAFAAGVRLHVASAEIEQGLRRLAADVPGIRRAGRPEHPWYSTVISTAMISILLGNVCPHLGQRMSPMFCALGDELPEVQCPTCWGAEVPTGALAGIASARRSDDLVRDLTSGSPYVAPNYRAVDEMTCNRCHVYASHLTMGFLPFEALLVCFCVCSPCAADLGLRESRRSA